MTSLKKINEEIKSLENEIVDDIVKDISGLKEIIISLENKQTEYEKLRDEAVNNLYKHCD